jgi:hypothetical protein
MIRTIYFYWDKGFVNAPDVVRMCLLSWKIHNPTWQIVELDDTNLSNYVDIKKYVPDIDSLKITKTALSDIIRICLLKQYGGVWCDATVYCVRPLDGWIQPHIESGFFAFEKPIENRLVASWFMYGVPDNLIVEKWLEKTCEYWKNHSEIHTYFWFHHLFGELYQEDQMFRNMWDTVKKMSAKEPIFLHNRGITSALTPIVRQIIDRKHTPMYKLTYKYNLNNAVEKVAKPKYDNGRVSGRVSNKVTDGTVANIVFEKSVLNYIMNRNQIKFIHIGKCGGTSIVSMFNLQEIHLTKPIHHETYRYIIWIRNPLSRFVSSFNMAHELVNFDTTNIDVSKLNLENCLSDWRIRYKMNNNHTYSPESDCLINKFGSPNNLAESITSPNAETREDALKLMNGCTHHIHRGIGWYLNNGDFVKRFHKNILMVGRMELMDDDLDKLAKLLSQKVPTMKYMRRNVNLNTDNTYLSELAIANLLEFYKNTDYKTLRVMHEVGLIDQNTLDGYYRYVR